MDQIDKNIIGHLLACSRKSFRSIADNLGVSCPTVKKRVERLRQFGVIQRFSVEMSHETFGTKWVAAKIQTNGREDKSVLLNQFDENECIREVLSFGNGGYLLFAEVTPNEKSSCRDFLDSLEGMESTEVSYIKQIPSNTVGGQCKYTTKGGKVEISSDHLKLLWHLVKNSRLPANHLSRLTGYSIKDVRRVLKQILEHPGIHFTVQLNLASCGELNFILMFDHDGTDTPENIADQLSSKHLQEHWFSMKALEKDSMMTYMTANNLGKVEEIIEHSRAIPTTSKVDAKIIYSVLKSEPRSEKFIRDYALDHIEGISKEPRKRYSGF